MACLISSLAARSWLPGCCAALIVAAASGVVRAQAFFNAPLGGGPFELSSVVHVEEIDGPAQAQLQQANAFLDAKQWDEATEIFSQLVQNGGDKVIHLDESRYTTLANHCQRQIAAFPHEALALYRQRVDSVAQRWYSEGAARRDRRKLVALVEQFLASSWGDDALMALGELALEEGDATAARSYWEMLIPIPPQCVSEERYQAALEQVDPKSAEALLVSAWYQRPAGVQPPVYCLKKADFLPDDVSAQLVRFWNRQSVLASRLTVPDTALSLADVRARLALTSIIEGSLARARGEIRAIAALHPGAEGQLGGRAVKYVAALEALARAAEKWLPPKPINEWPTFAGAVDRDHAAPDAFLLGGPAWKQPVTLGEPLLADAANAAFAPRRVAERADGLLSYHAVTAGNVVLVANDWQIFAFRVANGQPAWSSAPGRPTGEIFYDEMLKAKRSRSGIGVPRFTLTVENNKLYARLGSPVTSRPPDFVELQPSKLVCLDLAAEGMLLWSVEPDSVQWSFEGPAVAQGGNVYVAMRKSDVHPQAHVACLDATTGRRRWRRLICSAETPGGGQVEEVTHNLLTLNHHVLYYNTNLGAVAALSADSGRIHWITLYSRAQKARDEAGWRRSALFQRDLNPCVYYRGTLLVAPADSNSIFALDAASGRMRWQTQLAADVVHLLGVGGGNLLASGDSLWWIDVDSGKIMGHFPDTMPPAGPFGYGRGVLAGDAVYWPTREHLYVFNQRGGGAFGNVMRAKIPLVGERGASGGNLLVAKDVLLIAAADKLYALKCRPVAEGPLAGGRKVQGALRGETPSVANAPPDSAR